MVETLQRTSKDITEIYHRHVDMVYKICFIFLQNPADAEDAVQSTFIKLMESGMSFRDIEHEKAWLIVTARNYCKNVVKYWWHKFRTSIEDVGDQSLIFNQKVDETLSLVLSLPSKYKLPIYLYYYEGYSTKEIAIMLKIKESTLRSQLSTGRHLLKLKIGGDDIE
jgi:RNA polymerase sigma factor (sigma-70 family)